MVLKFLFLGRQPVLDVDDEVSAYLLRFHGHSMQHKLAHVNYTASISKLLHSFDITKSLEGKKGWIKIDGQSLINSDLTLLPKEYFVLYLMKVEQHLDDVFDKIELLMDDGYHFVLDATLAQAFLKSKGKAYLQNFDTIVFDGRKNTVYTEIVASFSEFEIPCAIRNITTINDYAKYKKEGFSLFLGSYFKEPKPIKGHQISSSRLTLLELLAMIKSDIELDDIVAAIKFAPDISLQLLQYINSANVNTTKYVESIKEAATLLGRKKLMAWVVLSLYSAQDNEISQVLIDTSMLRGHLMELLCDLLSVPTLQDQAFLVGLLSVSDAIFKVYLHSILESGNFSEKVREALLEDKGDLAKLLKIAKIIEEGNHKKMEVIAGKLKVPVDKFSEMLDQVYTYVRETKLSFGMEIS